MCTECGCGTDGFAVDGISGEGTGNRAGRNPAATHAHAHPHGETHTHPHDHAHPHDQTHAHSHDQTHAHPHDPDHDPHRGRREADPAARPLGAVHAPGTSAGRILRIEQDVLAENDRFADANRRWLLSRRILGLNLVSSPGSGKTSLLARTIDALKDRLPITVIEGDQQTSLDAERIRATGVPAVQINTGRGCHLDAHMVAHGLERLQPERGSVLFIENVGNLVCPAAFDLGEAHKVVLLSVTEGEDKPVKYPDMFGAADLLLITKADLLPYVPFDLERAVGYARDVNHAIRILPLSSLTGEGMSAWFDWITDRLARRQAPDSVASPLPARI